MLKTVVSMLVGDFGTFYFSNFQDFEKNFKVLEGFSDFWELNLKDSKLHRKIQRHSVAPLPSIGDFSLLSFLPTTIKYQIE